MQRRRHTHRTRIYRPGRARPDSVCVRDWLAGWAGPWRKSPRRPTPVLPSLLQPMHLRPRRAWTPMPSRWCFIHPALRRSQRACREVIAPSEQPQSLTSRRTFDCGRAKPESSSAW